MSLGDELTARRAHSVRIIVPLKLLLRSNEVVHLADFIFLTVHIFSVPTFDFFGRGMFRQKKPQLRKDTSLTSWSPV